MDAIVYKPPSDLVPPEWKQFLSHVSAEAQKGYQDYFYEKELWGKIEQTSTPLDSIEEREGFKVNGVPQVLEYIPEEYTIHELNRLFPGWWNDEMKRNGMDEIVAFEAVIIEGYLYIPYPTPSGTKVRKIWAIAGSQIKFKQDSKVPLDIADNFKGARTEWIRIAGKWLGIGLDIYHQKITADLRSLFEDILRCLTPLDDCTDETLKGKRKELMKEAGSLTTGQGFRKLLKSLATPQQISRFTKVLDILPQPKREELWKHFLKFSNKSEQATTQINTWLVGLETKIETIKAKMNTKQKEI